MGGTGGGEELLPLFYASLGASGKVLAISAVGIVAANYPKVDPALGPKEQRGVAKLLTWVVMPSACM